MARPSNPPPRGPRVVRFLATLALLAWGLAPVGPASGRPARFRDVMRDDRMSRADYERMERGYYESLLDAGRQLGAPVEAPDSLAAARRGEKRAVDPFIEGPLAEAVDDVREFVLKPDLSIVHWGVRWSTNSLGLRDRPYAREKPAGTFRIALVGDSIAAGWGVDDGLAFESILEGVLDARSRAAGGPTVEILNFAVPGLGPGQRWEHFRRIGWATDPDLVIIEATEAEVGWDERRLRALLPRGLGWDTPQYRDGLAAAGARPGGDAETYKRALRHYKEAILAGVYRSIAAECRTRGVPCVWVLIPRVGRDSDPAGRRRILAMARSSGFSAVEDLSDVYRGVEPRLLAISPKDYHPNADGHARLAHRLDEVLSRRPEIAGLWTSQPRGGTDRP